MHCSDTIPCHRGVVTVSACSFPGDCDTQSGLETAEEHISQETRATGIGDSLLGLGPWRFRLEKWSLCLSSHLAEAPRGPVVLSARYRAVDLEVHTFSMI